MSLFKSLFSSNENEEKGNSAFNWITFNSLEILEKIKQESNSKPVLIFKHSTRCGISRMVKKQFENLVNKDNNKYNFYYLDLLSYRDISKEVSTLFEVTHQSPQVLIIKNKTVVAHASHYEILDLDYTRFI